MMYFSTALIILSISILIVILALVSKLNKENEAETKQTLANVLDARGFFSSEILVINKLLSIAVNRDYSKIAIIENFDPNNPYVYSYQELATTFIYEIAKNNLNLKINYVKQGDKNTLYISPVKKETKEFFHRLFQHVGYKKIENKYADFDFKFSASSDWECSYIWAYSPFATGFAYFKTTPKQEFQIFNLRKSFFTIDTKYNYFELLIKKTRRQLLIYEPDFLDAVYKSIFDSIKQKTGMIVENSIYYDNHSNIVYLSNSISSLQSILLDEVEEIDYDNNCIHFSLFKNEKRISFPANAKLIEDIQEFIIGYNLRKIAKNFDYKTDKLINTTPYTKFIVDFTRHRVIYCANLNKISQFSFLTVPFEEIQNASLERFARKLFVRIYTKNKEAIDISCTKPEIAHYIYAQLQTIL